MKRVFVMIYGQDFSISICNLLYDLLICISYLEIRQKNTQR